MGAGRLWKGQTGLPDGALCSLWMDRMTLGPKDVPVLLCAKQFLLIRVSNEILLTEASWEKTLLHCMCDSKAGAMGTAAGIQQKPERAPHCKA